ncbi:DUF2971 domain-containing protein [Flavobacterium faecale]|uniref:DUF2971 domain-containing protein n=1 Tax=Flavobacterium faecale TaxID=1355330 RepID=UPI003AAE0997
MAIDKQISKDFVRVDDFISTVIHPVLPNAKLKESFINGAPTNYFEGKLSSCELFKETDYEYKGDGKFIHHTSLFALKAILDSGYLRMSEFGNLIDTSELHYGASVFKENSIFQYEQANMDQLRKNVFCLSACQSSESTKTNELMWEVYGDKGKGVIIEFELTKKNPRFFILGKMQYGIDGLKPLTELKKLAENYINNKDNVMFPNNFPELLLELQSFHKAKRYEGENEIRLLFKKDIFFPAETIYQDINSNQEVKYFNKLFLKGRHPYAEKEIDINNDSLSYFDEFPQIEIKNIILGFNISVENKVAITDLLNGIRTTHNYEFEIFQINNEKEIIKMR